MTVLVVETSYDGGRHFEFALDPARGDGISLQVDPPDGYSEPLPLDDLTALELDAHDIHPGLRVTVKGNLGRVYELWPESVLHVGYEVDAGLMQNHARHEAFPVGELASVSLDLDRLVALDREAV